MLHSKAKTPEKMRKEIVELLKYNASVNRSHARLAKLKTTAKEYVVMAATYEAAATLIDSIVIDI